MLYKLSSRTEKDLKQYCVTITKTKRRYCFGSLLARNKFMRIYERNEALVVEDYAIGKAQSMATADWTIIQEGIHLVFKYKDIEKYRIEV